MPEETRKQRLRLLLLAGIAAPLVMALIGFLLAYLAGRMPMSLVRRPDWLDIIIGVATGLGSMGLVTLLYKSHPSLERALRRSGTRVGLEALESAGYPVMLVVVTGAALGEEILFRGGVQPWLGLIPAALLFGFSHGGWRRDMLPYAVAASLSGAAFGLAYRLTDNLWVPITAHACHNVLSTLLLGKRVDLSWDGLIPHVRLLPEPIDDDDDEDEPTDQAQEVTVMTPTSQGPYPMRPTARALGLTTGILPIGHQNDVCDVPGVLVGHMTLVAGDGPLVPGEGPVRTGVTAVLPHGGNLFAEKVPAGLFVLNGFGKSTGLAQLQELGTLETPILLTNTLSAFRAADGLISCMIEQNPEIGITTGTVNPVVGECNDGYLSDIQGRHVTEADVRAALAAAGGGPVQQGAVGAGTGVMCYGFKGGIGSASRVVGTYTIGALVQANFGRRGDLMIAGVPVGQRLLEYPGEEGPEPENVPPGSIMVILATDAPLDARQLTRLCKRGALGLARTGASAGNGSGDFVIGFSTAQRVPHQDTEPVAGWNLLRDDAPQLDRLFLGAVEAVEESVLNALFCASTVTGRDGHVAYGLPVRRVLEWVKRG